MLLVKGIAINFISPPNPCRRLKARRGEEEVPQEERAGGESNKR
jgi:hypothetical protein